MVSWLAKFNPFTMIFTTLLIVFLGRGASEISTKFELNQSFSDIVTGIILFFIIGCEFFINYKINFRKPSSVTAVVQEETAPVSAEQSEEPKEQPEEQPEESEKKEDDVNV